LEGERVKHRVIKDKQPIDDMKPPDSRGQQSAPKPSPERPQQDVKEKVAGETKVETHENRDADDQWEIVKRHFVSAEELAKADTDRVSADHEDPPVKGIVERDGSQPVPSATYATAPAEISDQDIEIATKVNPEIGTQKETNELMLEDKDLREFLNRKIKAEQIIEMSSTQKIGPDQSGVQTAESKEALDKRIAKNRSEVTWWAEMRLRIINGGKSEDEADSILRDVSKELTYKQRWDAIMEVCGWYIDLDTYCPSDLNKVRKTNRDGRKIWDTLSDQVFQLKSAGSREKVNKHQASALATLVTKSLLPKTYRYQPLKQWHSLSLRRRREIKDEEDHKTDLETWQKLSQQDFINMILQFWKKGNAVETIRKINASEELDGFKNKLCQKDHRRR